MKAIGPRDLLAPFGVPAVLAYLGIGSVYSTLPALPTPAGVALLVLAVAELIMARALRSRTGGRPAASPVPPLVAARAVALAQASALAGAVMGGVWLGLLGFLWPRRDELAAAAEDTPATVVGLVSAAALVGAALWLQHCCRLPPEDDHDRPPRAG